MIYLKLAVAVSFLYVAVILFCVHRSARLRFTDVFAIADHRSLSRWALLVTLVAVGLTEIMVRTAGGVQSSWLFWVHLSFSVPFLLSLFVLRWLNGIRVPALHKVIAYGCLGAFTGTFLTGMILLVAL